MSKLIDWIVKRVEVEWEVTKKAPIAFAMLILIGGFAGYEIASIVFRIQLDNMRTQIVTKDGIIGSYRLTLKPEEGKSVLIELNNQDLRDMATNTSKRLWDTCFEYRTRSNEISALRQDKKIDEKESANRQTELQKTMGEKFARELRADALIVDTELRRRLGEKATSGIVGTSPWVKSNDGTVVSLYNLIPAGFGLDVTFTCNLANEVEQMTKLLPSDSAKQ